MESRDENVIDDLKQRILLAHINRYYKKMGYPEIDVEGYCHGLTLLWLAKMADGNELDFYTIKTNIIKWSTDENFTFFEDVSVQKFLAQIEFAQNPEKYTYDKNTWGVGMIEQKDVDKILETPKQKTKSGQITRESFVELICANLGNAICITSRTKIKHTIGIFIRDNKYFLFDPNFRSGKAIEYESLDELFNKIGYCLYSNLNLELPKTNKYSLEIKIVQTDKKNIYKPDPTLFSESDSNKRKEEITNEKQSKRNRL